jgi:hypothetical protein
LVEPDTFEDIHFKQFQSSLSWIPLVVANQGKRRGYLVRVKQGPCSFAFFHTDYDDHLIAINYGLLQHGSEVADELPCASCSDKSTLETLCYRLSKNIQSEGSDVSALFLELDQNQNLPGSFC